MTEGTEEDLGNCVRLTCHRKANRSTTTLGGSFFEKNEDNFKRSAAGKKTLKSDIHE
jgi:hypothetical protein